MRITPSPGLCQKITAGKKIVAVETLFIPVPIEVFVFVRSAREDVDCLNGAAAPPQPADTTTTSPLTHEQQMLRLNARHFPTVLQRVVREAPLLTICITRLLLCHRPP